MVTKEDGQQPTTAGGGDTPVGSGGDISASTVQPTTAGGGDISASTVQPTTAGGGNISASTVQPTTAGGDDTNIKLVPLGLHLKGDEKSTNTAKVAKITGYNPMLWCDKYIRLEIPAEWYLNYEVKENSKMSPVDPITKSILLFHRIFERAPDSMEEIMRCYDSSNEMYAEEDIRSMEDRISRLVHQEHMKIPQHIRQQEEEDRIERQEARRQKKVEERNRRQNVQAIITKQHG